MKKSITIVLAIVILVNTLIPNFIYASEYGTFDDADEHQKQNGSTATDELWNESKAEVTPGSGQSRDEKMEDSDNIFSVIGDALCYLVTTIPSTINSLMNIIVYNAQEGPDSTPLGADKVSLGDTFTIQNLLLGRYTLFNIDYFREVNTQNSNKVNSVLVENVSKWYYTLRNLSMVISLLVLVYIGIRMAISTVASDKAKYKKMFTSWVSSFMLLFAMHYIVIFLIELQEILLKLIEPLAEAESFEQQIIENSWDSLRKATGWDNLWVVIQLCMLVYYQLKFFIMYFKRVLEVGFLLVISPLVTITYPIDKAGDGKAQAYSSWLSKMIYNIFIQVIHICIYIIFIFSAAEIAKRAPIVAILFLGSLCRVEKIIKTTLGLKGKGIGDEKIRKG